VERTLLSVAFELDFDFDDDFEVERTPLSAAFEVAFVFDLKALVPPNATVEERRFSVA
jgi:hypothetical protein